MIMWRFVQWPYQLRIIKIHFSCWRMLSKLWKEIINKASVWWRCVINLDLIKWALHQKLLLLVSLWFCHNYSLCHNYAMIMRQLCDNYAMIMPEWGIWLSSTAIIERNYCVMVMVVRWLNIKGSHRFFKYQELEFSSLMKIHNACMIFYIIFSVFITDE